MNISTHEIYTVWNEWLSKQPSEIKDQWNEKLNQFRFQSEMELAMESIIEVLTSILMDEPMNFSPSKNKELRRIQKEILQDTITPQSPFLIKIKDEWDRSRWIHAIEDVIKKIQK